MRTASYTCKGIKISGNKIIETHIPLTVSSSTKTHYFILPITDCHFSIPRSHCFNKCFLFESKIDHKNQCFWKHNPPQTMLDRKTQIFIEHQKNHSYIYFTTHIIVRVTAFCQISNSFFSWQSLTFTFNHHKICKIWCSQDDIFLNNLSLEIATLNFLVFSPKFFVLHRAFCIRLVQK